MLQAPELSTLFACIHDPRCSLMPAAPPSFPLLCVQGVRLVELGDLYFDVSLLLWCCSLVWLTQQGLCSAYVPMLMVAFPLATRLLLAREFKHRGEDEDASCCTALCVCVCVRALDWFSPCRSVAEVQRAVPAGPGAAVRPLHVPGVGRLRDLHPHHGSQRH